MGEKLRVGRLLLETVPLGDEGRKMTRNTVDGFVPFLVGES
jgi:hypothetical protein